MAMQRDPRSDLSPRKVADRIKEEGKQRLERGKATAADQVDHVASALKSAGDDLGGQSTLGSYATQLADSIGRLGTRLREGSIEDLARDIQTAARRNPALFVAGGLALGIVLARLVKASATEEPTAYAGDFDAAQGVSTDRNAYSSGVSSPSNPAMDTSTVDITGDADTDPASPRTGG